MAIATLKAAKLRSFLTMLGVIIGVVSVVTVVGIGEGIKNQVASEIDQLGQDLITVRAGSVAPAANGPLDNLQALAGTRTGNLAQADVDVVRRAPGVALAAPVGLLEADIKVDGKAVDRPLVLASTSDLGSVLNNPLEYGEFFGADEDLAEQPNVAVIGQETANRLFGERSPLGGSFEMLGQTFFVRGVFKEFSVTPLSLSTDLNNSIIVPYKTAQTVTKNNVPLYEVLAKPSRPDQTTQAVAAITERLDEAHQGQERFSVVRQDQSLAFTDEILSLLTLLIAGIAAISLLVGGIGIMDVMLVSVAERMHEIGLRKALGASNRQIMLQFLTESSVLSFTGGIIGVIAAFAISFVTQVTTPITPAIPWWAVALSLLVSLVIGVIFGTLPALKAARKDPIDALRNQ